MDMNYTDRRFKLKKILLTVVCLFFLAQAHSQSLSAKELVNFLDNTDKTGFLKSRSFTVLGSEKSEKGTSQHFLKNGGTSSQETIIVTETLVNYLTHNKDFIINLLNQLKQHYKQTVKDDNAETAYYLFSAGEGKNVSINMSKTGASYYSLEVIEK
jgi:hypothetical protein